MFAIETNSLTKEFGKFKALDNISIQVEEGQIFGFLGPNGAGKSTTMMILTTLLKPTFGTAHVAGFDVTSNAKQVRQNIGFVQQETTVDEFLTGRENLLIHAKLNHIEKNSIEKRIDEIIELVELKEKQHDAAVTYSGGMRKRLDIAGGLLHRPRVLFLDEPTVGLDIQTRRKIWNYIKKIHDEFKITIFLSTHYMEEADRLCDKIAIIDYGQIQANDTPRTLKKTLGRETINLTIANNHEKNNLIEKLNQLEFVKDVTVQDEKIIIFSSNANELVPIIFQTSSSLGIKINSLSLTQPTLDDVFIAHTGHQLRDDTSTKKYNRRKEHNISMRRRL